MPAGQRPVQQAKGNNKIQIIKEGDLKMPKGDGTGPNGLGGRCTPYWNGGRMPRPTGFAGLFRFAGRIRGYRHNAAGLPAWMRNSSMEQPTKEQEIYSLEQDARNIEGQLVRIRQKIAKLKGE